MVREEFSCPEFQANRDTINWIQNFRYRWLIRRYIRIILKTPAGAVPGHAPEQQTMGISHGSKPSSAYSAGILSQAN